MYLIFVVIFAIKIPRYTYIFVMGVRAFVYILLKVQRNKSIILPTAKQHRWLFVFCFYMKCDLSEKSQDEDWFAGEREREKKKNEGERKSGEHESAHDRWRNECRKKSTNPCEPITDDFNLWYCLVSNANKQEKKK